MEKKITFSSGYRNVRILLIEDNPRDIRLIKQFLKSISDFKHNIYNVSRLSEALKNLEKKDYDVILLDLELPDSKGLDTILKVREKAREIPIIILTGLDDARIARKAIQMGVQDYLIKGQIDSNPLVRSINYAIDRHKMNLTIRSFADSLQKNEIRLRKIIEDNADGIIIINKKNYVCFLNPTAEHLLDKKKDEIIGDYFNFPVIPNQKTEFEIFKRDGERIVIEVKAVEIEWDFDSAYLLTLRDVSERKQFEIELQESEKKYRDLFENSPYPILIIGMDGTIIDCNSRLEKLIGYGKKELVNKHFKETPLISEDSYELFNESIKALQSGEIPESLDLTFKKANQKVLWISLNFSLMQLKRKLFIHILIQDLTELEESRLQLRKVEQILHEMDALIEHAPQPIFLIHQNGKILRVNEETKNLFGYEDFEFLTLNIFNLFDETSLDIIKTHYEQDIYKLNLPNKLEATVKRKDGKLIDVELTSAILKISDKIIIQTFLSDITERKNSEKHRHILLEQLLALVEFKTKFLATISHELRTPLNAILGFSQLLLEGSYGQLNKNQTEFLEDICSAGDHLLSLINAILDLSRFEAGKLELQYSQFLIKDVLNEVITIIKPLYEKKELKYSIEGIEDNDSLVADNLRFKQMLYNLLSNAIKFTEKGSIVFKGINRIDHWEFQVQDTGIGIAKQDFEIVFREFELIENDQIKHVQGAGLGLALTKKLVQLHGGDIWFESELEKGTTFFFTIPKKKN